MSNLDYMNKQQFSGTSHPYTCPKEHLTFLDVPPDTEETLREYVFADKIRLVALGDGWHCPAELCNYKQEFRNG